MKRLLSLFIVCILSTVYVFAYDWTDENGVTWTFSITTYTDDAGQPVTGACLAGMMGNSADVIIPDYVYDVETSYPVVTLQTSTSLFYNREDIETVKFPSTLRNLENGYDSVSFFFGTYRYNYGVFAKSSNLTTVDFNNYAHTIGEGSFSECYKLINITNISEVSFVDNFAFYECHSLISVDFPKVATVGNFVFGGCSSLKETIMPQVTSLGEGVFCSIFQFNGALYFSGCQSLEFVYFPSVISVGDHAFHNCSSLMSVYFPIATFVGDYAFGGCESLENVFLPKVETLGRSAFCGFSYKYDYYNGSYDFHSVNKGCKSLKTIDLPSVNKVNANTFSDCSSLEYVGLPVATSIGDRAFQDCSALTAIELPAVSSIGNYVFTGCSALTFVDIPNATSIGDYTFQNCSALTAIEVPTATSIGNHVFTGCSALTYVDIPNATSIGAGAFCECTALASVELPNAISIGDFAFNWCFALTAIGLPNATSIGYEAFRDCSALAAIELPNATSIGDGAFCECTALASVELPNATSIGSSAFEHCSALTSIELPNATSVGSFAFNGCSALSSVEILSATSIEYSAFTSCSKLTSIVFGTATPATLSCSFESYTSLVVPDNAYDAYVAAWSEYKNQITISSQRERDVNVVAKDVESVVHRAIGEENLRHVLSLKVKGSINGYDIMILRNKMINLHYLDLSEATIEGNDYEYYTGYHTSDNEIGPYAFCDLTNLFGVKLPEVTAIQQCAFANCANLCEVNLPESLTTLSKGAFISCSKLPAIEIPGSVTTIQEQAFESCSSLTKVILGEGIECVERYAFTHCGIEEIQFPESLKTICFNAFSYNQFEEANFPPNLETIDSSAFQYCPNLQVVRLNPMLKNISNNTFLGCNALKKVYTYTVEPISINQNTFSAYQTADLYVPTPSYYTYYYNTQWSQFLSVNKSDEEYDFKSFYINKDYTLDDTTGNLGGEPDGELGENSGLIHNGSETQALGTVTMRFNGNNGSASIIANGNLTAEKIKVEITVTGNKWHFFSFPFDVPLSGVSTSGDKAYVFRHYNAEKRATGASGWENLPADQTVLKAGEGYIFQANGNTTLTVEVDNKTTFVGENVATALHVQNAENAANASWNFTGNPGYAYFDIDDLGFTAPITVWDPNTNSYVALRPGDDDAFLHPFQAFFVQKPEGTDVLTYNAEDRTTYLASQAALAKKADSRRRAQANAANNPRKLINLSVTDGANTDKTRVVFNDEKSMAYEMDCDAAKFAATGVPLLYSIGNDPSTGSGQAVHYAINERPNGDGTVRLGFTADKAGDFSIEAGRMDTPCYLRDLETGYTHDFNDGAYEFTSAQGTFENRFLLVNVLIAEGIETIELDSIAADTVIYDLQGRRVYPEQLSKGVERADRGIFVVNGKKVNVK